MGVEEWLSGAGEVYVSKLEAGVGASESLEVEEVVSWWLQAAERPPTADWTPVPRELGSSSFWASPRWVAGWRRTAGLALGRSFYVESSSLVDTSNCGTRGCKGSLPCNVQAAQ